nr:MAG TPA: UBA-like domain protein [Caudoviricetes sp.]
MISFYKKGIEYEDFVVVCCFACVGGMWRR